MDGPLGTLFEVGVGINYPNSVTLIQEFLSATPSFMVQPEDHFAMTRPNN